jgi:hypothetical protein
MGNAMDNLRAAGSALAKAKRSLGRLNELNNANSVQLFIDAWANLLNDLKKTWDKLKKGGNGVKGFDNWLKPFSDQRKKDELILYLWMARNADNHGLEKIVDKKPPRIAFGNPLSSESGLIANFKIFKNGQYEYKYLSHPGGTIEKRSGLVQHLVNNKKEIVSIIPGKIRPVQVSSKSGKTVYPPPKTHLGKPIDPDDILAMAFLGFAWYQSLLDRAEKFFKTAGTTK